MQLPVCVRVFVCACVYVCICFPNSGRHVERAWKNNNFPLALFAEPLSQGCFHPGRTASFVTDAPATPARRVLAQFSATRSRTRDCLGIVLLAKLFFVSISLFKDNVCKIVQI